MRTVLALLSVVIACAGLSCGGDAQPGSQANAITNGTPEPIVGGTFQTPQSDTARCCAMWSGSKGMRRCRFAVHCLLSHF